MRNVRFICLALACVLGLTVPAVAAEVDCDAAYCFTAGDFSETEEPLRGICITGLPESDTGTVMLGSRVLRPGDILTAQQVEQMTFNPLRTQEDKIAEVTYLPIFEDRVETAAVMKVSIRGKEDKAPVAQDSALETYKNLSNDGKLLASDPEEQTLTYTLVRQPRRGDVELRQDGTFTYTPKKNKVGVDSFTFTATDPAGKVSREATVTITILKPSDAAQYTDTIGRDCRFTAEWMRHSGIFVGEQPAGNACFSPDKAVTRGEFTAMLVKALDIPQEEELTLTGYDDETPQWLKPYLAAAVRSGLTAGLPEQEVFDADTPITGAEAAVMLQNALDLKVPVPEETEAAGEESSTLPVWAEASLKALSHEGFTLDAAAALTRGQASMVLYQAVQMKNTSVFAQ